MKAYIAAAYAQKDRLSAELDCMEKALTAAGYESICFVRSYNFSTGQQKEMMAKVMQCIDECSLMLAETSEKAIGVGVEAGYARGRNIPVIYLRRATAEHSGTVSGLSDYQVIYNGMHDLYQQLTAVADAIKASIQ